LSQALGVAVGAACVLAVVGAHAWAKPAGPRRRVVGALIALASIAAVSVLYFTGRMGDRTFAITLLVSVIGTTAYDLVSGRRPSNGR
jgi:hypothetical protein